LRFSLAVTHPELGGSINTRDSTGFAPTEMRLKAVPSDGILKLNRGAKECLKPGSYSLNLPLPTLTPSVAVRRTTLQSMNPAQQRPPGALLHSFSMPLRAPSAFRLTLPLASRPSAFPPANLDHRSCSAARRLRHGHPCCGGAHSICGMDGGNNAMACADVRTSAGKRSAAPDRSQPQRNEKAPGYHTKGASFHPGIYWVADPGQVRIGPKPPGPPRGLRSYDAECSAPPQSQHRAVRAEAARSRSKTSNCSWNLASASTA
jgi:hypothetical protein